MKLYNVDVGSELLSELMGHGAWHIRSACIAQTTVHMRLFCDFTQYLDESCKFWVVAIKI